MQHLTQIELGRRAKMDRRVITSVEQGEHPPSMGTLYALAQALAVSVSCLMPMDAEGAVRGVEPQPLPLERCLDLDYMGMPDD